MRKDDAEGRLNLTRAYADVFSSPQGKMVLANLKKLYHVEASGFTDSALVLARNEGQREVVLHIMRAATLLDKTTTKEVTDGR
jgi:hypothetical protein